MKLSILVVSYNTCKLLQQCIASFCNLNQPDCELIILDNNSDDGSKDFLSSIQHECIRIIFNSKNEGFAVGMNKCFKIARGIYIMTFNPDAMLIKGTVEEIIRVFEQNNEIGLIAVSNLSKENEIEYPVVDFKLINKIETLKLNLMSLNKLEGSMPEIQWIWGTGITVRRSLLQDKMFNEKNFLFWEEYYLAKEIKSKGFKMVLLKNSFVQHFGSESFKNNLGLLKNIRLLSLYNGHEPKMLEYGSFQTKSSYVFIVLDSLIVYSILKIKNKVNYNIEREKSIIDLESKIIGYTRLFFNSIDISKFQQQFIKRQNTN